MKRRGFWGALLRLPLFGFLQPTKEADENETIVKWIDASERLPKLGNSPPFFKSHRVLVACADEFVKIGQVWDKSGRGDGSDLVWADMDHFVMPSVRFWAELPLALCSHGALV